MANNRILISVIIPSYNRADMVSGTIDSILAQKVEADLEIVIGDDCSTDNTREVLSKYKSKYPNIIHLIFHEHNIGLGANWATCILECHGKYICNCDNDDFWHNHEKLQSQLEYMESHPHSNVLFTDYREMYRDTGVIIERTAFISKDRPLQNVIWGDRETNLSNATVMYRSDFLKKHLNLTEWLEWKPSLQDWNAWVILAAYTEFDLLHVSTATICLENTSITRPDSVESLANRYEKEKLICRYLGMLFPDKFPFDNDSWDCYVAGRLLSKAYHLSDWPNAMKYANLHPSGVSKIRIICAKNWLMFKLFCLLKSLIVNSKQRLLKR